MGTFQEAKQYCIGQVDRLLEQFPLSWPEEQSKNYVYPKGCGESWTEGFWPGMLNLAYEMTGDEKYKKAALAQVELFRERMEKKINIGHHDMGFLYTPSCVAAYKLYGDERGKETALMAADNLMLRFHEKGGFIQAWGSLDVDPQNYRLIIDCLLNIPLLFWATEVTGEARYRGVAETHLRTAVKTAIRGDFTTYHTFYFDPETGAPLRGVTAQGYADDSVWARGQAWGVYGLALGYHYTGEKELLPLYDGVTKVFLDRLPKDHVPFWDMVFTDGSGEPRDSSSAAIAACGILEMDRYYPNPAFRAAADTMMESLCTSYLTSRIPESNGILTDSMYSRPKGDQPECSLWGDYFFMEALMRMEKPDWKMYW